VVPPRKRKEITIARSAQDFEVPNQITKAAFVQRMLLLPTRDLPEGLVGAYEVLCGPPHNAEHFWASGAARGSVIVKDFKAALVG
jgi:hypothetical protein